MMAGRLLSLSGSRSARYYNNSIHSAHPDFFLTLPDPPKIPRKLNIFKRPEYTIMPKNSHHKKKICPIFCSLRGGAGCLYFTPGEYQA